VLVGDAGLETEVETARYYWARTSKPRNRRALPILLFTGGHTSAFTVPIRGAKVSKVAKLKLS
jgi:hypothetical protein